METMSGSRRTDVATATLVATCAVSSLWLSGTASAEDRLSTVETWMYQIQDLDAPGAVDALAATSYDMLVLEPGHNFLGWSYDTADMIERLAEKPSGDRRLLLAYVDVGQAEDYRDYWRPDWQAPTEDAGGWPTFLVTIDPDGWSGNYPVAYWDPGWQTLWLGADGIVAELAQFGFDGVYLDWIEAHDDDAVRAAAERAGVDPDLAMIAFIEAIGAAGRAVDPGFLVVPQNAPYLIDAAPARYAAAIDALAVEDTWFHGEGDADWDDPAAGDLRDRHFDDYRTEARLRQIGRYQAFGLPVFSVDYAIDLDNVDLVYREAARHGLVPLVTRVSLSRLTTAPPPRLMSR